MKQPLLSIITICKNEPFIESTCQSITEQTNQNFEWIVIDGASTDETIKKLEKYKSKMTVFISEPDEGVYNAMNKGISKAKGKYVLFMNGGDLLYDNKTIEKVCPYLRQGQASVYYGDSYRLFSKQEECFIKTYPDKINKKFFLTNTLAHQSSFIRRDLFATYGLYREDFKIVSDKEKWLKFIDNHIVFQHIPFPCSCFRMNGISRLPTQLLKTEKKQMLEQYFDKTELYNTPIPYLQQVFDK